MKKTVFVAVLASLSLGSIASAHAWAGGVVFCSEPWYGGSCTSEIPPGNYTLQQLESYGFLNDQESSVSCPEGFTVQLYVDNNFSGAHKELVQDGSNCRNLDLIGMDDTVSSVRIRFGVVLYEDIDYSGPTSYSMLGNACYILSSNNLANWASSVTIPYGWAVGLYDGDTCESGYLGTLSQYDSNSANFLNINANDIVSSVYVYKWN